MVQDTHRPPFPLSTVATSDAFLRIIEGHIGYALEGNVDFTTVTLGLYRGPWTPYEANLDLIVAVRCPYRVGVRLGEPQSECYTRESVTKKSITGVSDTPDAGR